MTKQDILSDALTKKVKSINDFINFTNFDIIEDVSSIISDPDNVMESSHAAYSNKITTNKKLYARCVKLFYCQILKPACDKDFKTDSDKDYTAEDARLACKLCT